MPPAQPGATRHGLTAADAITVSRFPLAVAMGVGAGYGREGARPLVAALLGAAVVSDLLDGWVARRTGTSSRRGALLDSAADAAVALAIAVSVGLTVPLVVPAWLWWGLAAALLARTAAAASWAVRFRRLAGAHTWGNKAAGVASVAAVFAALATGTLAGWPTAVACVVAVASGVDEAILAWRSREFSADVAGAWRA